MPASEEQPIAFMSKALTATQQKWTTIEQECYAIFLCIRKYEYLLRDVKFTLKTDHANLRYLNVPTSNKVFRWKLAIQEYDFDVQHIAGVTNIVADSFSRLVEATKVPIGDILAINERNDSTETDSTQSPLSQNSHDLIASSHNSWMGHRGVEATCRLLKDEGAA